MNTRTGLAPSSLPLHLMRFSNSGMRVLKVSFYRLPSLQMNITFPVLKTVVGYHTFRPFCLSVTQDHQGGRTIFVLIFWLPLTRPV